MSLKIQFEERDFECGAKFRAYLFVRGPIPGQTGAEFMAYGKTKESAERNLKNLFRDFIGWWLDNEITMNADAIAELE